LDAYLKKVGAWTMEEVYQTRLEELDRWISENEKVAEDCKEGLGKSPDDSDLQSRLKKAEDSLERLEETRSQVLANRSSSNWL
jgi:RNA processing factor Prp31